MTQHARFLVAAAKSWNRDIFQRTISKYQGHWSFIDSKEQLNREYLETLAPDKIFFLHWSWKVPLDILENYECICFHMTDLPYGRGGSPLQNLIVRGHKDTKLTAFRMVEDFDAGPVYLKRELSLAGSAQEIFLRASHLAAEMILPIISEQIVPHPQSGEATQFPRRKPEQSRIPETADIVQIYDFIRMLDAEGYPRAFLNSGEMRYEFHNARLDNGRVIAEVSISHQDRQKKDDI